MLNPEQVNYIRKIAQIAASVEEQTKDLPSAAHTYDGEGFLTLNQYQAALHQFLIYPNALTGWMIYPTVGMAAEAGEACNKVNKLIRDRGYLSTVHNINEYDKETVDAIIDEVGDTLFMVGVACSELGITLEEVAIRNYVKLEDRKARGVISGSGDKR